MAGARADGRLTVGQVIDRLGGEFPALTISKLRFLESEGLLEPARTAAGYRTYAESDLDRLRFILTAQRDRFWPLKVIRDALDAMERGLEAPSAPGETRARVPASEGVSGLPTASDLLTGGDLRMTATELAEACDAPESLVEDLASYGLVRGDGDGHFGAGALEVARAAAGLAAYGLEPRHLRPFRTAAEREVGLVEQALGPVRGDSERPPVERAAEVLQLCIALHAALVKDGLARG